MKAPKSLLVAAFILAASLFSPQAQAARVNFTNLNGIYTGTYRLVGSGTDLTGQVTVLAQQSNNGNKVKLSIFGYVGATSGPPPASAMIGTLTLNSSHVLIADNVILAYITQLPVARSTFTGTRSPLTFTLTSTGTPGSATYTMRFNRMRLSIIGTATLSGTTYNISLIVAK